MSKPAGAVVVHVAVLAVVEGVARRRERDWAARRCATHECPSSSSRSRANATRRQRLPLWSGVSIAREPRRRRRLSFLSLGMRQLALPELWLVVPAAKGDEALATLFDLLASVVKRGRALPEGDTVGPTEHGRWPVHYVPSPVDPKTKVWRVEMK